MNFIVKIKNFQKQTLAASTKDLRKKIKKEFRYIVPKKFRISYQDAEEDHITIANEDDFEVLR